MVYHISATLKSTDTGPKILTSKHVHYPLFLHF